MTMIDWKIKNIIITTKFLLYHLDDIKPGHSPIAYTIAFMSILEERNIVRYLRA